MITAGSILTSVLTAISETDRNTMGPLYLSCVGRAYKLDVVSEHWWLETLRLFQPADAVSVSTAHPIVLPSDFRRMRSVRDANYTYYEDATRGTHPIHPFNWYFDEPVKTPLQEGGGAAVSRDSAVVDLSQSGLTVSTSAAGEWIHIGQSDDVYLISTRDSTTQVTLNRNFRSKEDVRNAAWQIRPVGTKRIRLCNQASVAVSPTTLTCEYQCSPLSVISEDDLLELPDEAANAVLFKATQYAMRRKGWNNAASGVEEDYRHALAIAKKSSPMSRDTMTPKRMFRRPTSTDILRDISEA